VLALAGLTASSANLIVGTAFAWFAGYEVRSQQQLMHALVDAETKLADQAAAAERQRIAREVHDLVAHTLSVTMLHLTGARLALQDADVTEATAALMEAERAGREAVREMRQAVGLLGKPSTGRALPGAADVPELIASYQHAGLRVAVDIHGDLGAIPDEPEFAALLERWIGHAGYQACIARTGHEALRAFYERHPDLVLLDVSLPGLDGWQVIDRIREFSRVPIIMATARGAETDKIRGLKLGADDYITKPLSFPELMARIEAALRRAATVPVDHRTGFSIAI
jgi:CheY-like chemotaxis protein